MALRLLQAQQISTGKWLQRVDVRDVEDGAYVTETAAQFNLATTDIRVVADPLVGMTKNQISAMVDQIRMALASGMYGGTGVILSPPAPAAPLGMDDALAAAITTATTLDELKSALLGKFGAARVKGRPT